MIQYDASDLVMFLKFLRVVLKTLCFASNLTLHMCIIFLMQAG